LHAIIRQSPRHATAWPVFGQTQYQLGRFSDAESAFTTCIALWPDVVWAYLDRGIVLKELGRLEDAEADFTTVLERLPDCIDALVSRAMVRTESKRWVDALADLKEAQRLAPASARIHFIRANVYQAKGDLKAMAAEQAEAMALPPDDEICWVIRGVDKISRRDAIGALADFDAALALNPKLCFARQNKAHVLSEMLGKNDEAIAELTRLLDATPDFSIGLRGRGVLYARQKKRAEAIADGRRALELQPTPECQYQVAGIYALSSALHREDRDEALRLLSLALNQGFGLDLLDQDPELEPLRLDADFVHLVNAAKKRAAAAKTMP
jgi:tetratricopeptide (TPR) repeat protein